MIKKSDKKAQGKKAVHVSSYAGVFGQINDCIDIAMDVAHFAESGETRRDGRFASKVGQIGP